MLLRMIESRGGLRGPQVPEQPLFRDALGNPPHHTLMHAAEKRLRLLDDRLVPRLFGLLQLFVEPVAEPREEARTGRLFCVFLVSRLVVGLEGVVRDRDEVNV
jgi:hypothetical protein